MTAQRIALTLSTQILPLCLALSSIGCSGGVNDALSLPDGSASLDNVSINAGADAIKEVPTPPESATPASGNDAVTARAFSTCPTETMTPVDMTKAACLVGRYQGALYNDAQKKFEDKPCKVALLADGRLTLSVDGVAVRTHQLSHHPYAENASDASAYVFLNPGSTDLSPEISEGYPLGKGPNLFLSSYFQGSGAVNYADVYQLYLRHASDNLGGSLFLWLTSSIINDQQIMCAGLLGQSPTSPTTAAVQP